MVIGILSGINTFFNYGKKENLHNQYQGLYDELACFIQHELVKPKKYRIACDVFLEKINNKMSNLNNHAPII